MIKLLAAGVWVSAVTLASAFAAISWKSGELPKAGSMNLAGGLATIKTRLISVPIIAEGAVQGYVVAQFTFLSDPASINRISVKPEAIFVDEAFQTIYSGQDIDFRHMARQDLSQLKTALVINANNRLGHNVVREVLIEELNYIPKDQVRKGPDFQGRAR